MLCVHFLSFGAFLIQLFWWFFSPSSRYTVLCSPPPPPPHTHCTLCSYFSQIFYWVHSQVPPFGPIEGQKWFFQISSQWKSRKNLFHVKKKSSKIRRKTDVKVLQIYFVLNRYRRKSNLGHTAMEFFCSGRHMIEPCPKLSCLTALIRFLLFKGPGSFKKS